MTAGVVVDASGLFDLVTGQTVYGQAFVSTALERADVLLVPATALTTTAAALDHHHLPLMQFFLDLPSVVVEALDEPRALGSAAVLRGTAAARSGLVEGQVVSAARGRGWRVFTRAPEPLWAVDPSLVVQTPPSS